MKVNGKKYIVIAIIAVVVVAVLIVFMGVKTLETKKEKKVSQKVLTNDNKINGLSCSAKKNNAERLKWYYRTNDSSNEGDADVDETESVDSNDAAENIEDGVVASTTSDGKSKSDSSTATQQVSSNQTHNTQQQDSYASSDEEDYYEDDDNRKKVENVQPGWLYYKSIAKKTLTQEDKAMLDAEVASWVAGNMTDEELTALFNKHIDEWGFSTHMLGVSGNKPYITDRIKDESEADLVLNNSNGSYHFVGCYTKGEYDEYGYLICYDYNAYFY